MKFSDFVCFKALVPDLEAETRDEAVSELVLKLSKARKLGKLSAEKITKAIVKRENEASTGLGKGVAVPHVKIDGIKKITCAIGLSTQGIDFAALDKQLVFSIILLVSPVDSPDLHLKAMETVFKNLQQEKFRKFLGQCQTSEAIEDLLREAEETPFY
ncbi:MAG: PTS sugar transporter subunit IIA [Phycisphaerae bacterium]|nr:PTS sugar transporter subunit IIA [Phycisphaerae bacterium]